ncbi:MAG: menaquinone biosynthesis decarboxylase [Rikenellaceae bacterium]|jgi:4-hydroxy-3-polyprenylbenzoate decarboxylase|nr:menaquinone biosynthesis decarboxylase [Rikenellaceae bacterium]
MFNSLTEYIKRLEAAGELVRVGVPVDPVLEMAEIADRAAKSPGEGPALLFENTGTGFPVLMNSLGSERRMALALGVESLDELSARIRRLTSQVTSPPGGMREKLRMLPLLGQMSRWLPVTAKGRGECQQVVLRGDQAALSSLPILKCWPHDGGRFVTLPVVCTVDPDTGSRNAGMYRMQVFSDTTTGMHWHLHKTGERHYRAYQKLGRRMPVSVCLGGDPAYTYAATAPMPDNMDEWLLAGFLRRKPVRLVKCVTNELYVPADCDIVLEGWVDPAEAKVTEGPFGDHTGFYSLEDLYPVFHLEAITHRRGAIYPATIVGVPPQEDAYISQATEKIFLEPIRLAMQPEVRDLWMPAPGVSHNLAVVSIESSYPGQPFKVAGGLWGAGQMMFNKMLAVTTAGVNIHNPATMAALLRRSDPARNLFFSRGVLDVLDHTTATSGEGGKVALDLTSPGEERPVRIPDRFSPGGGIDWVDASLAEGWSVLLLYAAPGVTVDVPAFLDANGVEVNFVILLDTAARGLSAEEMLWLATGNCEPTRDMHIYRSTLIADSRSKLPEARMERADKAGQGLFSECRQAPPGYPARWPNVVTSSAETIALVDRRWADYGLGGFIPSPSLRYTPLLFPGGAEAE